MLYNSVAPPVIVQAKTQSLSIGAESRLVIANVVQMLCKKDWNALQAHCALMERLIRGDQGICVR